MCLYVCIEESICMGISIYVCAHVFLFINLHMHVYVCIHGCICVYINWSMYLCISANIHA